MKTHIYNKFPLLHVFNVVFNMNFIRWNKDKTAVISNGDNKFHRIYWSVVHIIFVEYIFYDTFYYMITAMNYGQLDIIYIIQIPMLYISTTRAHFFLINNRENLAKILNDLDQLDKEVNTYVKNSKRMYTYLWNSLICFTLPFLIIAVWLHFHKPCLKIYTIQIVIFTYCLNIFIQMYHIKTILIDNCTQWNAILHDYQMINREINSNLCAFCCKNDGKLNLLCDKHLIR